MAVNDIQLKCEERSDAQRKLKVKNVIHHKVNWPSENKPENFNDPLLRVEYAKAQMESIKMYLSDYIQIMNKMTQDEKIKKYLQGLRDTNSLI